MVNTRYLMSTHVSGVGTHSASVPGSIFPTSCGCLSEVIWFPRCTDARASAGCACPWIFLWPYKRFERVGSPLRPICDRSEDQSSQRSLPGTIHCQDFLTSHSLSGCSEGESSWKSGSKWGLGIC